MHLLVINCKVTSSDADVPTLANIQGEAKKYTLQLIATLTRVLLVYTGIKSRGYLIFSYFSLAKVMNFFARHSP